MRSRLQSFVHSWAQLFGFFALALVISTADCRTRVKAQEPDDDLTVKSKWCNREYYIATYGEPDWHWWWGVHMCWIYTENAALPTYLRPEQPVLLGDFVPPARRFVIGGR